MRPLLLTNLILYLIKNKISLKIIYMDTKYIIIYTIITVFVLFGFTYASFAYIPKYWVNLLVGSILFGTFFGTLKNSLNNKENDFNMTLILIGSYLLWFFCTKLTSGLISKENVVNSKQDELDNFKEQKVTIENKPKDTLKYFYPVILIVIFITLIFCLNYSYLPISIFLFISIIFTYLTNNRLDSNERIQIISFTISFGIIFGILAPLFLFDNFNFKNSITNSFIFFAWISLTQATSKFLTPTPQEERY